MCNLTNLIVNNTIGAAVVNASTNASTNGNTNGKFVPAKAVEAPKPVNADNPWTCVCGYRNENSVYLTSMVEDDANNKDKA
ncbi:hypothetical protein EV126DRAFT_516370 [Verticillium dahliae]|nr:hypothetical protein EV126DRAFT_516370 [Verticillium dahliae]